MISESSPSISPRQMQLLRAVTAMAWADGQLEPNEVQVMLEKLSAIFAVSVEHQDQLATELQNYLYQNTPLEEVIPKLDSVPERELVLKLGYEVIYCSSRTPHEARINMQEAATYQKLLQLVALPPETVTRLEQEAIQEVDNNSNLVDNMAKVMELYFRGH